MGGILNGSFLGGDMKSERFPRCGGGRRRGSPEIEQVPAASTGSPASSDPGRDITGPIKSRENPGAPAPPGANAPGERPAAPTASTGKRLNTTADWPLRVLALVIVGV